VPGLVAPKAIAISPRSHPWMRQPCLDIILWLIARAALMNDRLRIDDDGRWRISGFHKPCSNVFMATPGYDWGSFPPNKKSAGQRIQEYSAPRQMQKPHAT